MAQDTTARDTAKREPFLRIEDLTKMFGSFAALKDVALEVFEGEFVCFLDREADQFFSDFCDICHCSLFLLQLSVPGGLGC